MNYIKELRDGEMVSEIYLCKNKVVAKTKAGKTYYSLQLQDKTGTVDAKIWELSNAIAHFEPMDYIRVDAQVTSFNGALQLNVKRVRVADEGEYNVTDYMPCSTKDIDTMYQELLGLIQGVKNQYLHKLLEMFFVEDKEFAEKFKNIVMGTMMIADKVREIPGFPPKLANELKHCILAHHGELEYGSPKKPALIEAMALAHADNMDAKLQTFTEIIRENEDKTEWLGFNRMFESNVRLTGEKNE